MSEKSRRWMVTMWDFNKVTRIKKHLIDYGVVGKELAPTTGKLHFQCYFEFLKPYDLGSVKRVLCDKEAHCEPAIQDRKTCSLYCSKQEVFLSIGNNIEKSDPNNLFDIFDIPENERGYDGH